MGSVTQISGYLSIRIHTLLCTNTYVQSWSPTCQNACGGRGVTLLVAGCGDSTTDTRDWRGIRRSGDSPFFTAPLRGRTRALIRGVPLLNSAYANRLYAPAPRAPDFARRTEHPEHHHSRVQDPGAAGSASERSRSPIPSSASGDVHPYGPTVALGGYHQHPKCPSAQVPKDTVRTHPPDTRRRPFRSTRGDLNPAGAAI